MLRIAFLFLLVSTAAVGFSPRASGDVIIPTSEPCVVDDIGDSAVERWFETVHCDIHRAAEFGPDVGLMEVVLGESRLVRRGHLEPESWSSLHNNVGGTLYAAEVVRNYWSPAAGPVDSLLTQFAMFSVKGKSGDPGVIAYPAGGDAERGQAVAPGDRVLALVERVEFGPQQVGRTQLWRLRRALIIGPQGYSAITSLDLKAAIKRLGQVAPSYGVDPESERELSEPMDAASVESLIMDVVRRLEATFGNGTTGVGDDGD